MSLGTVLDRIPGDVARIIGASGDPRGLGLQLCDAYYYLLLQGSGLRPVLLSQRLGLSQVPDPQATYASYVIAWITGIVGTAIAGFIASAQIEARYLALFGP